MNAEALGKAISEATIFLQDVHNDTRSQIGSLDRLMAERNWVPAERNRVSGQLGNSLSDGRKWVPDYIYRCYTLVEESQAAQRVIAVFWYFYFDPGDAYEVASCTVVAARLGAPMPPATLLLHDWNIGAAQQAAGRSAVPIVLSGAAIKPLLPSALAAAGFVLPLCELTSDAILEDRLVSPILAAEAALGAPK